MHSCWSIVIFVLFVCFHFIYSLLKILFGKGFGKENRKGNKKKKKKTQADPPHPARDPVLQPAQQTSAAPSSPLPLWQPGPVPLSLWRSGPTCQRSVSFSFPVRD